MAPRPATERHPLEEFDSSAVARQVRQIEQALLRQEAQTARREAQHELKLAAIDDKLEAVLDMLQSAEKQ